MTRRVYGVETEYGLVGRRDGRRLPSDEAGQRLFAPLAGRYRSTNAFLGGGGRLYLDVGSHPEYATPECTSARDLVVAQRAGDELLLRLAAEARAEEAAAGHDTTFTLTRNNVDSFGNTWGSHENYLVSRQTDPAALSGWLAGFLAARPLIAGAGRWRRGRFTLSQRGDVLGDVVSAHTTRSRPLINTRDEPHADPARYRRLHVIAGDTLCLETTMWLAVVATELVVRCAESGRTPPPGPADVLGALRSWNADPDAGVPATDGTLITARTLQRAYLDAAVDAVSGESADQTGPGWTAWRDALDALDAGRPSTVEWDVKRRLLTAWRDRHGVPDADPRLDALDLRWHELGDRDGRPAGLARLAEARGRTPRLTTDAEVTAALTRSPSPSRARVRGALLDAALAAGRDHSADWSTFAVHDLAGPDGAGPAEVLLGLDDPFADACPAADALIARMTTEPRVRALGGFRPPGVSGPAG